MCRLEDRGVSTLALDKVGNPYSLSLSKALYIQYSTSNVAGDIVVLGVGDGTALFA
jgi:hypothetical protein